MKVTNHNSLTREDIEVMFDLTNQCIFKCISYLIWQSKKKSKSRSCLIWPTIFFFKSRLCLIWPTNIFSNAYHIWSDQTKRKSNPGFVWSDQPKYFQIQVTNIFLIPGYVWSDQPGSWAGPHHVELCSGASQRGICQHCLKCIFCHLNLYFIFSITRRSRSDESHSLTEWVSEWVSE